MEAHTKITPNSREDPLPRLNKELNRVIFKNLLAFFDGRSYNN